MKTYSHPVILTLQIEGSGDIPPGVYDTKVLSTTRKRPDGTIGVKLEFCTGDIAGKTFNLNVR